MGEGQMSEEGPGRITQLLLWVMLLIVWGVWAPVGFFLWIPLLIRVTLVFAGLVVHAVITRRNLHGLRSHLEAAIDFWFYGFRAARDTILHPDRLETQADEPPKVQLVLVYMLWALAVWLVAAWFLTPQLLHQLFESVGTYAAGRRELWLLLVVLLLFASFVLGRAYQRISDATDKLVTAAHKDPLPDA
jgi:hypothetical protein